ncbi:Intracellular distribution of mitochondria [Rhodotorula kratochvilovae]
MSSDAEQQQTALEANGDAHADQHDLDPMSPTVEVTLLVPAQSFLSSAASPAQSTDDGFLELPLPIALSDVVHDLKSIITDAPEGFWLGAFSLAPVYADEVAPKDGEDGVPSHGEWIALTPPEGKPLAPGAQTDPKQWALTKEGVLGDYADLTGVFGAEPEFWEGKKRGLKVIFTPFAAATMHQHLLKVRETLFSSLPPFASTSSAYDPTAFAIAPGSSLYASVCGEPEQAEEAQVAQPEKEVEEQDVAAAGKGKKAKGGKKAAAPAPVAEETPAPAPARDEPHAFTGWTVDALSAENYLQHFAPSASPANASPCLKALGVSPWSPPPHPRRLRGDLVYLTVSTLESEQYTITGAASGFWISKSTNSNFDPSPRAVLPKGVRSGPYQSLFELLAHISPSFRRGLSSLIAKSSRSDLSQSELVASLAVSHTVPAAPWLVRAPQHVADPFRTQAAYLLTSSTAADQLPPARDWNDEFGQYLDLPRGDGNERLLRERLLTRTQADFVAAATRGAVSISRGDVPPINPNEPASAYTYIHNNLLFTKAEDGTGIYAHLGGDDAARYVAGKDLRGVELLERLDVDGLSVMQTVLIDYLGERWIVQSLIPGLFKAAREEADAAAAAEKGVVVPNAETPNKDDYPPTASFRIVYGAAEPEKPDEKIRAGKYFHEQLASKVARQMRFAEHDVKDQEGQVTRLWTASDMHGIAATDGRSYFIDCFRMQCVDVEFREKNMEGDVSVAYPHRLVLLRPELLEAYRETHLHKWLEAKVSETRAKVEQEQKDKQQSIEAELKDAASEDAPAAAAEPATKSVINADDFVLNFNPDAFVERKPTESGDALVIYDPEDESTKNVRLASQYLRDVVLGEFLSEAVASTFLITDGAILTTILHRKGVNMRYLGLLVRKIDAEGDKIEHAKISKDEAAFTLALLKRTLQHEMVIRGAKHALNALLRASESYDHAAIVAHFYNCLLGASFNASPIADVSGLPSGVDRAWTAATPSSVRADITREVAARFRYELPAAWFDEEMLVQKVARELSLRVGAQLVARKYEFGTGKADLGEAPSEAERAAPAPAAAPAKKGGKKGKKGKAAAEEQPKPQGPPTTFRPEDVLNLGPVVKATVHRSLVVEDAFAQGTRAIMEQQLDLGEALVNDALHLAEQVFGAVHPEAAQKYHQLGIVWHNLAQRTLSALRTHDMAEQALKELPAENREQHEAGLKELLLPNPDASRQEAEAYLQQAVRLVRQSIVVAERTSGIDSHEAITQYTDLGLLEHAAGNYDVALKLTKHAADLWAAAYGPNHPLLVNLLSNAAATLQTRSGIESAIPLQKECVELAKRIYGADSVAAGQAEFTLGQGYAVASDLASAQTHLASALKVLQKHLGDEAREVQETTQFLRIIEATAARDAQEQAAREERLKQRFAAAPPAARTVGARGAASGSRLSSVQLGKQPAVNGIAEPAKRTHGEKADLSVDALVDYIQGSSSNSKQQRKRKPSP